MKVISKELKKAYVNEELKGNTVMTYASGELVSSIFIGV